MPPMTSTKAAKPASDPIRLPAFLPPHVPDGRPKGVLGPAVFAQIAAPAPGDDGREGLAAHLEAFFDEQAKAIADRLKRLADIPDDLSVTDWDDPMASAMTPVLRGIWSDGGRATCASLGLDPDEWRIVDPNVSAAIDKAAFDFCQATNATTSLELGAALAKLREELKAGLIDGGETLDQLKKRVQGVFDKASDLRADRIAETEAARAMNSASLMSAAQSGVVRGKRWLLSDDACPPCKQLAAKANERPIALDEPFGHVGNNPTYAEVLAPPGHPGCQCTLLYSIGESDE